MCVQFPSFGRWVRVGDVLAIRGYRFAQPPVIRTRCSPVLRTTVLLFLFLKRKDTSTQEQVFNGISMRQPYVLLFLCLKICFRLRPLIGWL